MILRASRIKCIFIAPIILVVIMLTVKQIYNYCPKINDKSVLVNYQYKLNAYEIKAQDVVDIKKAANQGSIIAKFMLGLYYSSDKNEHQDYLESVKWFTQSAKSGHAISQYRIGVMYSQGLGVLQNNKIAAKWLEKAAISGIKESQYCIGRLYEIGVGVDRDYARSFYWYMNAANRGSRYAQSSIGTAYFFGRGCVKNLITSYMWLTIALVNGESCSGFRNFVGQQMSPDQIIEASYLADEWTRLYIKSQNEREEELVLD